MLPRRCAARGEAASGTLVSVPPLSYGFYVFPEAGVKVCLTSRQAELSRQVEAADGVKHLFDGPLMRDNQVCHFIMAR